MFQADPSLTLRDRMLFDPKARAELVERFACLALIEPICPIQVHRALELAARWHGRAFAWEVRARVIFEIGLTF